MHLFAIRGSQPHKRKHAHRRPSDRMLALVHQKYTVPIVIWYSDLWWVGCFVGLGIYGEERPEPMNNRNRNRCVWWPEVARRWNCEKFLRFFGKRPLTVKFLKLCSVNFHRFSDRRWCVKIAWNLSDGKSVKSCVICLTKNYRCLSKLSLLHRSRPQSAGASPQ